MQFGPAPHPTQKAPPEVNRYWRRMLWDTELQRLYTKHLPAVSASIDHHQRPLYLENTFHVRARQRALQLHEAGIARENVGLFKRLMAVHTRKPKEFAPRTPVDNHKVQSRNLEYERVREDNARLVQRLIQARSFVNERGSWDEHALEHEVQLTRASLNPRNCFIPNLHSKRRQDKRALRERSLQQQAQDKLRTKVTPLRSHLQQAVRTMQQQEEKQAVDGDGNAGQQSEYEQEGNYSQEENGPSPNPTARGGSQTERRSTTYDYPLPPSSSSSLRASHAPSSARRHSELTHPPVPPASRGRYFAAPPLDLSARYNTLQPHHARRHPSSSHTPRPLPTPPPAASDTLHPYPYPYYDYGHAVPAQQQQEGEEGEEDEIFYIRPCAHGSGSGVGPGPGVQGLEEPFSQAYVAGPEPASEAFSSTPTVGTPYGSDPRYFAAEESKEPLPYPSPFPSPPAPPSAPVPALSSRRTAAARRASSHAKRMSGSLHASMFAVADALDQHRDDATVCVTARAAGGSGSGSGNGGAQWDGTERRHVATAAASGGEEAVAHSAPVTPALQADAREPVHLYGRAMERQGHASGLQGTPASDSDAAAAAGGWTAAAHASRAPATLPALPHPPRAPAGRAPLPVPASAASASSRSGRKPPAQTPLSRRTQHARLERMLDQLERTHLHGAEPETS